jgi:hypothetical protein
MTASVTAKDAEKNDKPADPEKDELAPMDPREMLLRKPMPYKKHVMTRSDSVKIPVLFQGLPYLTKQAIDARSRIRRQQDEEEIAAGRLESPRPSLWGLEIILTAMRDPKGRPVYKDEEIHSAALQWGEQVNDGEIQAAVDAVLEVSGWGPESAALAGKSSKRTRTIV